MLGRLRRGVRAGFPPLFGFGLLIGYPAAVAAGSSSPLPGDPGAGAVIYQQNCVACHGANLQGGIGKRLNPIEVDHDNAAFIIATVTHGIPDTQMPGWGQANDGPLTEQQIKDVASFILARQGQKTSRPAASSTNGAVPWIAAGMIALVGVALLLIVRLSRKTVP